MTTNEALQILDQAGSIALLNRQGHIAIQEAVATLRVALTPKEEPKQAEPSHDGAKEPVPAT